MLTANYTTPASEWTRAIDAALVAWSAVVDGDARFNIEIAFDSSMHYLAMARVSGHVTLGRTADRLVRLSALVARFQGHNGSESDGRITINPTYPWNFGTSSVTGRYGAIGVMIHELGHLFGFHQGTGTKTPYMIERDKDPARFDGAHFAANVPGRPLMFAGISPGEHQGITDQDLRVLALCGFPLKDRPSTFHLVPHGSLTCQPGNHTAVWWGRLGELNADLSKCRILELRGDHALTEADANLYRLYRAAFGRIPDYDGFQFWRSHSSTFDGKVAAFHASPEFQALYASDDRPAYVFKLYRNILGRDPDPSGYAYWLTRTDLSDPMLMAHFALSAENTVGTPRFSLRAGDLIAA